MSIIEVHENILNKLLEYRAIKKDFTFYLRKRPEEKLIQGFWFLGNENYVNVPLFKVGDNDNKTQTIGFVYELNNNKTFIEIVYKNINNVTDNEIKFYEELVSFLPKKEQKANDNRYWYIFEEVNLNKNLEYYLYTFRDECLNLLNKYQLKEKYIIENDDFNMNLNRIIKIKNQKGLPIKKEINTKNIIFYGVPGVGKTHNINKFINLIEKNEDSEQEIFKKIEQNSESNEVLDDENLKSRVVFTTFHQSFAYEDFIEGFRPNNAGQIILRDGIFKTICEDAKKNKEKNYYLVIDEINRGNISKIFGELITLIEESKRDKLEILLPYSQEKFSVPSNLFIIGTMNSTDKSIALIDTALRRRFTFLELKPNETLIQDTDATEFFIKLNEQLEDDYKIGHSYFMGENIDLKFVKEYKIKPLLKEYFYGNNQKLEEIMKNLE